MMQFQQIYTVQKVSVFFCVCPHFSAFFFCLSHLPESPVGAWQPERRRLYVCYISSFVILNDMVIAYLIFDLISKETTSVAINLPTHSNLIPLFVPFI